MELHYIAENKSELIFAQALSAIPPLGLMVIGGLAQGSSSVATVGFGAESLWDSGGEFPKGINLSQDIS